MEELGEEVKNLVSPVASMKYRLPPAYPAVRMATQWAFFNACIMGALPIYTFYVQNLCSATHTTQQEEEESWWSKCIELTGADAVAGTALMHGLMWCSAAQAAAAALARLLLAGRPRWALAVAATAGSHAIFGTLIGLFVGAGLGEGYYLFKLLCAAAVFTVAPMDVLCCLDLVRHGDAED